MPRRRHANAQNGGDKKEVEIVKVVVVKSFADNRESRRHVLRNPVLRTLANHTIFTLRIGAISKIEKFLSRSHETEQYITEFKMLLTRYEKYLIFINYIGEATW